jgi:hypothetical protein
LNYKNCNKLKTTKNSITKFYATILQQIPLLLNYKNCNKLKKTQNFAAKCFATILPKIHLLLNYEDCNRETSSNLCKLQHGELPRISQIERLG